MKTIFRFLTLSLVAAAGAVAGFGQTPAATPDPICADVDGQNAFYQPFLENYNKKFSDKDSIATLQATAANFAKATEAGKSFLEKYGACESVKPQVDFVKPSLPKVEQKIGTIRTMIKYKRFDIGVETKNWDEAFAAGKDILSSNGGDPNIAVALGLIGLDLTYQKNYKYSDDAIRYAKSGIALSKTAKPKPDNGMFGAFAFECKPAECPGDLTFAIAHMTFWGKSDKAGALPFYYDAAQIPGRGKDNAQAFEAIGTYYFERRVPIGDEIAKLIEKQKLAKTDEEKLAIDGEIKPKVALFNGYTERMIDAYGRAHKFTKDANRKATIYKNLQALYEVRTGKTDGLDTYLASAVAKPLPNPTSTVEPVFDPEPVPTTTTTTTGTTTATPAPATKPATTTPTKPVSTVGTKVSASAATSAASTDAVAKKPVAKKKGTR